MSYGLWRRPVRIVCIAYPAAGSLALLMEFVMRRNTQVLILGSILKRNVVYIYGAERDDRASETKGGGLAVMRIAQRGGVVARYGVAECFTSCTTTSQIIMLGSRAYCLHRQ